MLPINHVKDPLGKGLETHLPVLLCNIWENTVIGYLNRRSIMSEASLHEVRILSP